MIKRIRIQNYRSLIDVDVELGPLTVLIGRSGTGKSNFVTAIRALRDSLRMRNVEPFKGSQPIGADKSPFQFELEFEHEESRNRYRYQTEFILHEGGSYSYKFERLAVNEIVVFEISGGKWTVAPNVSPLPGASVFALGLLNGIPDVTIAYQLLTRGIGCYDFPGNVLQSSQNAPAIPIGLLDDGSNYVQATSMLRDDLKLYGDWRAITRSLSSLNPSVYSVDLVQPGRDSIQIGYRRRDQIVNLRTTAESEGFRRYFATLLALYQAPSKPLCIFEHPENGIHPGALEMLAGEFKRHVERGRGQVILTTHNPQFLDHFEPEQIRVVDIENQATKIGPLASEQMEALKLNLMSPGELLTVDPARLEGQLAEVPA